MERLGITMLTNDKSQLKRNVEQIGFQLVLKTAKNGKELCQLISGDTGC